jgi:transposase
MYYVGIDIAKQTHVAAILSPEGNILVSPFPFENHSDGFSKLLAKFESLDQRELLIGLESTSHYGDNLVHFLFKKGFNVCVINPIQTASLRKNRVRKTKTDRIDSLVIAKALILDHYRCVSERDIDTLTLKQLCRARKNLKKSVARAKIQLVAFMDQLFPEFQYFFSSGIHLRSSYALLKIHSSPDEIASMHLTTLTNILSKNSRGRFHKQTALRLRQLARTSVGSSGSALSLPVSQCIQTIEHYERQILELDKSIEKIMLRINSVILTIPGIGPMNGAMILGEIGDIHRFSSSGALLAFAGLDPTINQSGQFQAHRTRMSKRGSKVLRHGLMNAAFNIVLNDELFRKYYDAKRSGGRSHFSALGHVAGKLTRVIFKLLTENIPFHTVA